MILKRDFYNRDTRKVARELLGKYLVRKRGRTECAYMIIETEAYIGPHDKASHAYKGRTKRTETMFGPPGRAYIYLIYGMYRCFNIVTKHKGYPAAVLIRALLHKNATGPGKLSKLMGITTALNTVDITIRKNGLWIEDRGKAPEKNAIITSPRVGVSYAEEWHKKLLRYAIKRD